MAVKIIQFSDEARSALKRGIDVLHNAVASTMGPGGRTVVIRRITGDAKLTKDGVSVAREVELSDPVEDAGAQIVKAAAQKTNDLVGDGTTSSIVLTKRIIDLGLKHINNGSNAVQIKKGIEEAAQLVIEELKGFARPVDAKNFDDLKYIATISGNDEEVGNFVAEAYHKVGRDGAVALDRGSGPGSDTMIEIMSGYKLDSGMIKSVFATNVIQKQAILNKPMILLVDKRITDPSEMLAFLEIYVSQEAKRPLLIIAEDVEGEALATLVLNKLEGIISCCAVRSPGGELKHELMQDLAVFTEAKYHSEDSGVVLSKIPLNSLGSCEKAVITEESTTIIGAKATKEALDSYTKELVEAYQDVPRLAKQAKMRAARLAGGVAIIRIGYNTDADLLEKRDRFEDAVNATRAAIDEGMIPGGGAAVIQASKVTVPDDLEEDVRLGYDILIKSLSAPLETILKNAGYDLPEAASKIKQGSLEQTFNALTGEIVDAFAFGIVDPLKVTRSALEMAATTASLFLTTEVIMIEDPEHFVK